MTVYEIDRRLRAFDATRRVLSDALEDDELDAGLERASKLIAGYGAFLEAVLDGTPQDAIMAVRHARGSAADVGEAGHVEALDAAWAVLSHLDALARAAEGR